MTRNEYNQTTTILEIMEILLDNRPTAVSHELLADLAHAVLISWLEENEYSNLGFCHYVYADSNRWAHIHRQFVCMYFVQVNRTHLPWDARRRAVYYIFRDMPSDIRKKINSLVHVVHGPDLALVQCAKQCVDSWPYDTMPVCWPPYGHSLDEDRQPYDTMDVTSTSG